jgi:pSer/pThr/pTyr-binding forkhead associated (FHA) protein
VRKDGSEGESFAIGGGLEIGRAGTKMIFANDPFISPRHVRCTLDQERVHLVDLGARNGVYIRIGGSEVVYPGDQILLGNRLLRLDVLPPRAPVPADASGTRSFGTPLETAWGRVLLVGVDDVMTDIYELRGNPVAIGREVGDIVFPRDAFLSRSHCRLRMEVSGGAVRVLLEDAGSANGTYLRMRSEAWLGDGDMFRVGDQILKVRAG